MEKKGIVVTFEEVMQVLSVLHIDYQVKYEDDSFDMIIQKEDWNIYFTFNMDGKNMVEPCLTEIYTVRR